MVKLPDKLVLEIVTPERQVIKAIVDEVSLPASQGYIGVLPGHAPLLTTLSTGIVKYKQKDKEYFLFLSGGFAEVLSDKIIVLAQIIEKPEEIDVERAKSSKERAEKRLSSHDKDIDIDRAMASLKRALARIEVSSKINK